MFDFADIFDGVFCAPSFSYRLLCGSAFRGSFLLFLHLPTLGAFFLGGISALHFSHLQPPHTGAGACARERRLDLAPAWRGSCRAALCLGCRSCARERRLDRRPSPHPSLYTLNPKPSNPTSQPLDPTTTAPDQPTFASWFQTQPRSVL